MGAERTPTEKTIAALRRRIKPASIVAELSDGKLQPIDLGELRGRWERIGRTLQGLDWTMLRCYTQPDGKGEIIDTLPNEEIGAAESDAGADGDDADDRVDRLFNSCARHVDKVVGHIRKRDEDLENSRTAYIATLTERNMQLEALASDALAQLKQATEMIAESRATQGNGQNDKERAFIGAVDALGARFGAWGPGTILQTQGRPQLTGGPTNGSGRAETEGDV